MFIHALQSNAPDLSVQMMKMLGLYFIIYFFNAVDRKKMRTSKMQPLWISKDPCISEEKGKLIKRDGDGDLEVIVQLLNNGE